MDANHLRSIPAKMRSRFQRATLSRRTAVRWLGAIASVVAGFSSSQRVRAQVEVAEAEGVASPFPELPEELESYPEFGDMVPALRSFYLGFDIGDASPGDHEIVLMQVLAGGESEDLSPNADLTPANIPDGKLYVALQDASPSGEEFHYKVSHSVFSIPGARRYQIRDVGCVAECVRTPPPEIIEDTPVATSLVALVGFKVFFTGNREHEFDRVGVWFWDNDLHVALRDQNGDDVFGYLVDFVVIPTAGLSVSTGTERGTARGGERLPFPSPSHSEFVLRGWALNFTDGDHEIRDIGVDRQGDDLVVIYSDKNGDDEFDWRIEWAHVGPMVFA